MTDEQTTAHYRAEAEASLARLRARFEAGELPNLASDPWYPHQSLMNAAHGYAMGAAQHLINGDSSELVRALALAALAYEAVADEAKPS